MKKIILISVVGLLVALVVGFWVYSFLYGSPTNTTAGVFTNLGLFGSDTEMAAEVPAPVATTTPTVDVQTDRLRQLTTKPVIGMRVVTTGSSTVMRYVEAGTGQVFDIDLTTGTETRTSPVTIPVASEAAISPDGTRIAVRSGYTDQNEVALLTLEGGNATSKILPYRINSFHFAPTGELQFTEFNNGITEGKQYDPKNGLVNRIFTIPFTAASMAWSNTTSTPHYVFTKPADGLMGYGYKVINGTLSRLSTTGSGFALIPGNGVVLFGRVNVDGIYTWSKETNGETRSLPISTKPGKCVTANKQPGTMYCGATLTPLDHKSEFQWYKGVISSSDSIFALKNNGGTTQLAVPAVLTGRTIDVANMQITGDDSMLYFTNKIDNTLWVYEL